VASRQSASSVSEHPYDSYGAEELVPSCLKLARLKPFLAPVIGRYGGASSDLSLILDLVARELARKHTAFYNIGFSEAKAMYKQKLAHKWGHAIARGWATLLLDRLRDFAVAPSSEGGSASSSSSSSSLHDSQGVDELATLDRYHQFHGHSGLCA